MSRFKNRRLRFNRRFIRLRFNRQFIRLTAGLSGLESGLSHGLISGLISLDVLSKMKSYIEI